MCDPEKHTHYVLIGPKGKQAGRRDQKKIALQLVAHTLNKEGHGEGIAALLIPKKVKGQDELDSLLARGYSFKEVTPRDSNRAEIRETVMSDELMVQLAIRFEQERGKIKKDIAAVVESFAKWICVKISSDKPNDIQRILAKFDERLLDREKPGWWESQINQRVKNKKE